MRMVNSRIWNSYKVLYFEKLDALNDKIVFPGANLNLFPSVLSVVFCCQIEGNRPFFIQKLLKL